MFDDDDGRLIMRIDLGGLKSERARGRDGERASEVSQPSGGARISRVIFAAPYGSPVVVLLIHLNPRCAHQTALSESVCVIYT